MRLSDEMSKHWFGLSLALRKRYWDETKFGTIEPSEELKREIEAAIVEKENKDGRIPG